MLSRAVASRRATTSILTATRIATRQNPVAYTAYRSLSLWPFRKRTDPSLPVYFPKEPPKLGISLRPVWKKLRYGVFSLAIYIMLYQIFMSFVFDPLLDWSEEEWEQMSEKEKKAMEKEVNDDDDDPIAFFAWPFSTYEEESPAYKGSDPEWKEFVAINSDKKRQKEIKGKFAGEVKRRLLLHPTVQKMLGDKQQSKISRAWLDIIYPPKPPPVQYVSGLIIDDDGIFWGYRQMDELSMNYLKTVMWPKAVAMASWAFYSTLIPEGFSRIFSSEKEKKPVEDSWQGSILTRGKEEKRPTPQTGAPLFTPTKQKTAQGSQSAPGLGANQSFKLDAKGQFVSVDDTLQGTVGAAIFNAFKANMKPVEPGVSRGSIRIDGMIEFKGKGGLLTVMAAGWYDPKQKKYTHLKIVTKSFVPYNQRPMGGP